MDSVFQYHTPSIRRLPDHVWLRVRGELTGLIMERRGGCVYWYHRQLWEAAQRRYADEKLLCHYWLGKYFSGQISEDVVCAKKLTRQDYTLTKEVLIWFKDCIVNRRRGLEGYYHLCEYATAVLHDDYSKSLANSGPHQSVLDIREEAIYSAVKELCNLDTVACSAVIELSDDSVQLVKSISSFYSCWAEWNKSKGINYDDDSYSDSDMKTQYRRLYHYYKWVLKHINDIKQSRGLLYTSSAGEPKISLVRNDFERFRKDKLCLPVYETAMKH